MERRLLPVPVLGEGRRQAMAFVDKYADSNLAMVKVLLQGLSIDKLRLVLRFAESLVEEKTKHA